MISLNIDFYIINHIIKMSTSIDQLLAGEGGGNNSMSDVDAILNELNSKQQQQQQQQQPPKQITGPSDVDMRNNQMMKQETEYHEQTVQFTSKISLLKKNVQNLQNNSEIQTRDLRELQSNYSKKSREKNNIQELYNSLKRKYDQLCRDKITNNKSPTISNFNRVIIINLF